MNLSEVKLRNWKAYRNATLNLPSVDPNANVIVVMGANGAGKTSLFEAVAFALFGRHALTLVAQARGGDRPDISYDGFVERALNVAAKSRDARMSVELTFIDDDGELLSLERVWHFTAGGRHRRDDEELYLRQGEDSMPIALAFDADRKSALQAFVSEEILPPNIASFFIFDGEQLNRFANRSAEEQLKAASEIVAGAPELRGVAADLRAFARDRRRELHVEGDMSAVAIETELDELEGSEKAARKEVDGLATRIAPLRAQRDQLVRQIGALHGDSYANFKSLFEERETHVRGRAVAQEELRKALSVDLALALAGTPLRGAARVQLEAEDRLDRWESTISNLDERFDAFIEHLSEAPSKPPPPDVRTKLQQAWTAAWDKSPEDVAGERLHTHLGEADRSIVLAQLDTVLTNAGSSIAEIARNLEQTDRRIAEIEMEISRQRGLDDQAQTLADKLRSIQQDLAELESSHREGVQALDGLRLQTLPLRQELGRRISVAERTKPVRQRADDAEAYAQALEELVEDALPATLNHLAEAASDAYRRMAHKKLVQGVQFDEYGLTVVGMDGRDISSLDASAGETQIFALALMAAVAASFPYFPIVMDTPFARLDPEHRDNVLRHFSELGVQLILLAHPGEIDETAISRLGARFAGVVEVNHELDDELGQSHFEQKKAIGHGA